MNEDMEEGVDKEVDEEANEVLIDFLVRVFLSSLHISSSRPSFSYAPLAECYECDRGDFGFVGRLLPPAIF